MQHGPVPSEQPGVRGQIELRGPLLVSSLQGGYGAYPKLTLTLTTPG